MGQQQLLLILLGFILVAAAIAVGIIMFGTSASEANRDLLVHDVTLISVDAQTFYKKATELGGGGFEYTGFETSPFFKKYGLGKIRVNVQSQRNRVVINATGTEPGKNGSSPVKVKGIVSPNDITIIIKN